MKRTVKCVLRYLNGVVLRMTIARKNKVESRKKQEVAVRLPLVSI